MIKALVLFFALITCALVPRFAVAQEHENVAKTNASDKVTSVEQGLQNGSTRDMGQGHTVTAEEKHESAAAHEGKATSHEGGHGEGAEEAAVPELPSLFSVILHSRVNGKLVKNTELGHFLHVYEKQIFLVLSSIILSAIIFGTLKLRAHIPGKIQALLEMIVEGFYSFLGNILGEKYAREYTPFLGSLFIFIIFNNLMGIVPLFAAPTSKIQTTATLALIVFFYVHYQGIKRSGIKSFMLHLMGSPTDKVGWFMAPLMFPLEVIGTLAKPMSLALRLFGNIMGEDILVGVFLLMGMGMMTVVWHDPWFGIPLHLPFFFLVLLTSTIQALVFMLLSTIYLVMLLPHEEHHGHGAATEEIPAVADDDTPHVDLKASPFA